MSTYCQSSRQLLLSLASADWLPPPNPQAVTAVLNEQRDHMKVIDTIKTTNSYTDDSGAEKLIGDYKPAALVHAAALKRNKRSLLAYNHYRLAKVAALRWETAAIPQHLADNMSPQEIDFFESYDELLEEYQASVDCDLFEFGGGLTGGDGVPGCNSLVEVRVSAPEGAGEIMTDDGGTVVLEAGTSHFLKRGDVERLVRSGELAQVGY